MKTILISLSLVLVMVGSSWGYSRTPLIDAETGILQLTDTGKEVRECIHKHIGGVGGHSLALYRQLSKSSITEEVLAAYIVQDEAFDYARTEYVKDERQMEDMKEYCHAPGFLVSEMYLVVGVVIRDHLYLLMDIEVPGVK